MDNMILAFIGKEIRPLHYSIEVMFNVNERYGSISKALDLLQQDTKEGFDCLQYLAVAMANDAELCRRAEGYDKKPMLEPADISPRMKPVEFLAIKEAVAQAIELGYRQEIVDEDEEVDLGLEDLRKKAKAGG